MPTSRSEEPRDDEEAAGAVAGWMRLADEALGAVEPAGDDVRQAGRNGGNHARLTGPLRLRNASDETLT